MKLEQLPTLRRGKVVVFTNGVFDILHAGHVRLLEQAKNLGDILVVGVNSDASVRRLNKGPGRPINSLYDRITVLERLRSVDFVMPFDEDTPLELIQQLRPDIHVKGGDYAPTSLPEGKAVLQMGGSICILPLLEDRSTTAVVKKISGL